MACAPGLPQHARSVPWGHLLLYSLISLKEMTCHNYMPSETPRQSSELLQEVTMVLLWNPAIIILRRRRKVKVKTMHSLSSPSPPSLLFFPGKEMFKFLNRKEIEVVHTDNFCLSSLPYGSSLQGWKPFLCKGFPILLEQFSYSLPKVVWAVAMT